MKVASSGPLLAAICLGCGLLLGLAATRSDAEDRRNYASFYVERYGELSPAKDWRAARAKKAFEKVLASADKKANRFPQLFLLTSAGEPWALSLPDGSVVVTQGALGICYDRVRPEDGDARMAFVLGHELAHLANDDFWDRPAFDAVRKHAASEDAAAGLLPQLDVTLSDRKTRELRADSFGIIYSAMAGYDPAVILSGGRGGFFRHWASKVREGMADGAPPSTHHDPKDRAEFLEAQLQRVVESLDYFHFGVRFYQVGAYEEALELLTEFRKEYPGREVFNNIGLIQYQLAMEALSACDASRAYAFRPSLAVDPMTTGDSYQLRAPAGSRAAPGPCRALLEEFRAQMDKAVVNLRCAVDKDPFYLPAQLNLSSALLVLGRYSEALGVIDEALKHHRDDPAALNNKAVILYLVGRENGLDASGRALDLLAQAPRRETEADEILYNRAAILQDQQRSPDARKAWEVFLRAEPVGPYAAAARKHLGVAPLAAQRTRVFPSPTAPVSVGPADPARMKALSDMKRRRFSLAQLSGQILTRKSQRVLIVGSQIELVEVELAEAVDAAKFRSKHGEPERSLATHRGRTWVYKSFAADLEGGEVRRLVFF